MEIGLGAVVARAVSTLVADDEDCIAFKLNVLLTKGNVENLLDIFAEESARAFVNAKKQELDMDRSTLNGCAMTCKDQNCLK
jgi:hypothetical protein